MADVVIDLKPLKKFQSEFDAGIRGAPGPINDFFIQLATRVLVFWQRRFDKLSAGGGEWPPLKKSTIKARRKGGGKRSRAGVAALRSRGASKAGSAKILKVTGILRNALNKGAPGNVIERTPGGIKVGIDGGGDHPAPGEMTIGRLAEIHHTGEGKMPERTLVTSELDRATLRGISADGLRALDKLGRKVGGPL